VRVYQNLKAFVRERFFRALSEKGRLSPREAINYYLDSIEGKFDDFKFLRDVPRHLLLEWALSDPRIGIDDQGYLVLIRGEDEVALEAKLLSLVRSRGVVTLSELSRDLKVDVKLASTLANSLVRRGLLTKALVHDVLSEVPRKVVVYSKPLERSRVLHEYAKKVLSHVFPFDEEVRVGRYVYDLMGLGIAVEVVTTRLSEDKGIRLREKLTRFDGEGYAVVYSNRKREIPYLRRSAEKFLKDVKVSVMDLFEAVRYFSSLAE